MAVSEANDVASATLYGDATAHLLLDGATHLIRGTSDADARQQVLHIVLDRLDHLEAEGVGTMRAVRAASSRPWGPSCPPHPGRCSCHRPPPTGS